MSFQTFEDSDKQEKKPYYEKFLVGNDPDSPVSPYYEKYAIEEPSSFGNNLKRSAQIGGASTLAGATSIPRELAELGGAIKNALPSTANTPFANIQQDPNRPKFQAPELFKKLVPSSEEVYQATGAPEAEGAFEKGLKKFGNIAGQAPLFGGIGGVKGLASLAGLATGLQAGEEADFGPLGQMATGAVFSLLPGGATSLTKGITNFVKNPKKSIASVAASFTNKDKLELQKQIIENAREAGVKLDLGSITDNNIIKQMQSTMAQSGLTGKALDNFRKSLSDDLVTQYKNIADTLGEAKLGASQEAGEVLKTLSESQRDASRNVYRSSYSKAMDTLLPEGDGVFPGRVKSSLDRLESKLKPGSVKSPDQKSALQFVEDMKKDIQTPEGTLKEAKIHDLINDKIALHDIIDYEIEGGTKQILKDLAKEIDETIIQEYGKKNPEFVKEYKLADKKFKEHVETYRNKNISSILKTQDPVQALNKMKTIQGVKDIRKALSSSPEGKEAFDQLKRFKLDSIIEDTLEAGINKQAQFGRFAGILDKSNNREMVKELLGPDSFRKLENLMKTSGQLAESANKFLNNSQSAVRGIDFALIAKTVTDAGQLLYGNPWPLARTVGGYLSIKGLSKLISDPKFLKLTEDAVLALRKNNQSKLKRAFEALEPLIKSQIQAAPQVSDNDQQQ